MIYKPGFYSTGLDQNYYGQITHVLILKHLGGFKYLAAAKIAKRSRDDKSFIVKVGEIPLIPFLENSKYTLIDLDTWRLKKKFIKAAVIGVFENDI